MPEPIVTTRPRWKRRPNLSTMIALIAVLIALTTSADALPGKNRVDGGDIRNGTVTGKDVKNKSLGAKELKPRTGVVVVPWTSFFPAAEGGYDGYGPTAHQGRFLTGVGGNGGNRLIASVNLPHGAKITKVRFHYWDDSAGNADLSLRRFVPGNVTGNAVAAVSSTADAAVVQHGNAPVVAANAKVNNRKFSYVATMFSTGWTTSELQIFSIEVTYRL